MKAIDLFAGLGGFTTGAHAVPGVRVLWAANHAKRAVQYHRLNHPAVEHKTQDLQQADWSQVPAHDIQLASPCCQGHSLGRGKDRPHHDTQRSTAWAVVSCAEFHRAPLVVVENVPRFAEWVLFPAWEDAMSRLGYSMAAYHIDAADHGVAQNRPRLFMVFTLSKSPLVVDLPRRPHVPIADVIDWNFPKWSRIRRRGRSAATLRRIKAGRAEFGERFVAPYYGSGSGKTGRSINRPIGTITTLDRWSIIDGDRMRMMQPAEIREAMGFPTDCVYPVNRREAIQLFGNAVCPPAVTDLLSALIPRL